MSILLEPEQISLPLEFPKSKIQGMSEKEIIKLCKQGNEEAIESMYIKYQPLLFGPFTSKILNFNTRGSNHHDNEDSRSILRVIFMESLMAYNDDRASFSTYLVNRIRWKFRDKLFSERIIAVRNNRSAREMSELLDQTRCALLDIVENSSIDKSVSLPSIGFTAYKEDFSMPIASFIDGIFMEACIHCLSAKERKIYFFYMKVAMKELRGSISKVAKKFNMSPISATKMIQKCNEKVSQRLNIENIRFL